jgi:Flp pilus assembly protein TadG
MTEHARNPRRRRGQAGNMMVESALVFVGFMFLMFGIVEFGRMVFAFNFVAQGATEGARWASVRGSTTCPASSPGTNSALTTYVDQWAAGLTPANVSVAISCSPNGTPGSNVTVSVTYTWTAIVGKILPSSINFTDSSTMLIVN